MISSLLDYKNCCYTKIDHITDVSFHLRGNKYALSRYSDIE